MYIGNFFFVYNFPRAPFFLYFLFDNSFQSTIGRLHVQSFFPMCDVHEASLFLNVAVD